jgi:methylenetetrahydrofolate reductase (NADPH)
VFEPRKIIDVLAEKDLTLSVEIFPPRNGRDPRVILDKIARLSSLGLDFISITKGALGSHRGGTVAIGYMVGDKYGVNPLVHFRCRDLSRQEVENSLVDHLYFGIKNILAVMGDPLKGEADSLPDPATHHRYASGLVEQLARHNRGEYLALPGDAEGKERTGFATDFCIGVALYPEAEDMDKEVMIAGEKAKAGAHFGITQMFFDADSYPAYVARLRDAGVDIPVIPGVRPVLTPKNVRDAERVFGIRVPQTLKDGIEAAGSDDEEARRACRDFTVEHCVKLVKSGAPGLHFFILNDVDMAAEVIGAVKGRV